MGAVIAGGLVVFTWWYRRRIRTLHPGEMLLVAMAAADIFDTFLWSAFVFSDLPADTKFTVYLFARAVTNGAAMAGYVLVATRILRERLWFLSLLVLGCIQGLVTGILLLLSFSSMYFFVYGGVYALIPWVMLGRNLVVLMMVALVVLVERRRGRRRSWTHSLGVLLLFLSYLLGLGYIVPQLLSA